MCTMKKKFQMIGFALSVLLVALPVVTVGADNAASGKQKKEKTTESALGVKPVTGSWINLAYKDVRNKYTNPQSFDNMDPKLWEAKVRELSAMGIEYLVFMEVANEGKSYYPSQIMPWWYNKDKKSPVDAILDEAAKHNMKVFMSSGWAKDQDDNLLDPAIKERQLRIMEELASLAYQDEVGCVRDQFTLPRLKKNWQRLRDIHNRLNIEMWANCETFTWEEGTNDRTSALIPAAYPRLLSQQVAASAAGVDKIISFMFYGIIENPESKYQLGQPVWSNKVYTDYMDWKNGKEYWKLMEAAFMEKLVNGATPEMMLGKAGLQPLLDGKVAEEDSKDARWVKFEAGYHEFVVDLQKKTRVQKAMLRMLNYNPEKIGMPMKTYLYTSIDGKEYNLSSIKDAPYFPNNKHDAWIESILFDQLDENVRYVKVAFEAPQQVYIDEFFVNPVIR